MNVIHFYRLFKEMSSFFSNKLKGFKSLNYIQLLGIVLEAISILMKYDVVYRFRKRRGDHFRRSRIASRFLT